MRTKVDVCVRFAAFAWRILIYVNNACEREQWHCTFTRSCRNIVTIEGSYSLQCLVNTRIVYHSSQNALFNTRTQQYYKKHHPLNIAWFHPLKLLLSAANFVYLGAAALYVWAAASVGIGRSTTGIHQWCARATWVGTARLVARVKGLIAYEFLSLGIGLDVAQHQHRADENQTQEQWLHHVTTSQEYKFPWIRT